MSDTMHTSRADPRDGATVVESKTPSGRPCRLTDRTATLPREVLAGFLEELIAGGHMGFTAISAPSSGAIRLDEPRFTHVQLEGRLYRLLLRPGEARLERF
ncbi:MAG: hypothetical protein ACLFTM_05745 [Ectothiorhodospira sp.]